MSDPTSLPAIPSTPAAAATEERSKDTYLIPSLFTHRSPTVFFDYPPYLHIKREHVTGRPEKCTNSNKRLYFRISHVHEYNCVRNAWLRAGFRRTTGSSWNGLWSRHQKEDDFNKMNPFQKVNHFPGTWAIGRKDRLARNIARMSREYGDDFQVCTPSYHLPRDKKKLRSEMDADPKGIWILKPAASSCGRGIKLVSGAAGSTLGKTKCVAQKYVKHPYLIDDRKFDLRIYIVVTSFDPLRAYMFEEGLVRFCTQKYTLSSKNLKNRFAHLTNYSVNKRAENFDRNQDAAADGTGSKWSLTALRRYFREQGIDDEAVIESIRDVAIKTLIACESEVGSLCNRYFKNKIGETAAGTQCFEVFGFDVLLDRDLKPWLLEVNVSPSLSSSSPLDKKIKNMLITDTFHMVGYVPYEPSKLEKQVEQAKMDRLLGRERGGTSITSRFRPVKVLDTLHPSQLTEHELSVICETEDEFARRGHFTRIFPTPHTGRKYNKFFEAARFKNALLDMWVNRWRAACFASAPTTGIDLPTLLLEAGGGVGGGGGGSMYTPRSGVSSPASSAGRTSRKSVGVAGRAPRRKPGSSGGNSSTSSKRLSSAYGQPARNPRRPPTASSRTGSGTGRSGDGTRRTPLSGRHHSDGAAGRPRAGRGVTGSRTASHGNGISDDEDSDEPRGSSFASKSAHSARVAGGGRGGRHTSGSADPAVEALTEYVQELRHGSPPAGRAQVHGRGVAPRMIAASPLDTAMARRGGGGGDDDLDSGGGGSDGSDGTGDYDDSDVDALDDDDVSSVDSGGHSVDYTDDDDDERLEPAQLKPKPHTTFEQLRGRGDVTTGSHAVARHSTGDVGGRGGVGGGVPPPLKHTPRDRAGSGRVVVTPVQTHATPRSPGGAVSGRRNREADNTLARAREYAENVLARPSSGLGRTSRPESAASYTRAAADAVLASAYHLNGLDGAGGRGQREPHVPIPEPVSARRRYGQFDQTGGRPSSARNQHSAGGRGLGLMVAGHSAGTTPR